MTWLQLFNISSLSFHIATVSCTGNKYGEPVVSGFTRSYGQRMPSGERYEWIKPVMFTAGVGMLNAAHSSKGSPEVGMVVCKIGGPAYRIGMGGGAASSRVQSSNADDAALDFNAVQRGDAEMENRLNRLVRGCVDLGDENPIISIHDQVSFCYHSFIHSQYCYTKYYNLINKI